MSRPIRLALMVASLVAGFAAVRPAVAATTWPPPVLGGAFRYWVFDNGNDLRDPIVYWIGGPWVVQLEYWDFVSPDTPDQFRPELHWRTRDRRHSVYDIGWRHEYQRQRFMLSTEQLLVPHWVGRLEADPIVWADSVQVVVLAGADYYWGSYNFASAGVIRDPRSGGLWSFPMRARVANETNDWVQLTVTPTTDRTLGWSVDGKWQRLRLGIERNSRYDFTNVDNLIFTVGFETPFPKH